MPTRAERGELHTHVQRSLTPIATAIGLIFLAFSLLDAALRPAELRRVLVPLDVCEGAALIAAALAMRRRAVPARLANAAFAAMTTMLLGSLALTHAMDPSGTPLAYFGLVALGAGMVFLSWPWLGGTLALTLVAMVAASRLASDAITLGTSYYALAACGASCAVHATRMRVYAAEARSRAELRESEERFRRLADAASEAIVVHAEGRVLEANRAFADMFGYSPDEVVGMRVLDLAPDDMRPRIAAAIATGTTTRYEAEGLRKDGTRFPGRLRGQPIQHHGRAARVTAIQDLTLEKRAQAELREQLQVQSRLEKLATIGTLAAGVAHEVNNPLTFMTVENSLFLSDLDQTPEDALPPGWKARAEQFGTTNKQGIDRITKIVASLRLLAKPHHDTRVVELSPIVNAALVLTKSKLRTLDVTVDVPAGLRARVDVDGFGQVMLNLLINAADAAPQEGGVIEVRASSRNDVVRLTVRDNGPGIPAEARERIFTPFFTTKEKGTGLGLSISSRIAQDAGGTLRFEDSPGGGTVFVLELPAAEDADEATRAVTAAQG